MSPRPAPEVPKLQPKIRMIANGSTEVNVIRAEHSSALAVPKRVRRSVAQVRGDDAVPVRKRDLPRRAKPKKLRKPPDAKAHVFIHLVKGIPFGEKIHPGQSGRRSNIVAATVPIGDLPSISRRPEVAFIELGEPLAAPTPEASTRRGSAPLVGARRGSSSRVHGYGGGGRIGIVDVGGFEFSHPDFSDGRGGTRRIAIWDQGGDTRPPPPGGGPGRVGYGAGVGEEHL